MDIKAVHETERERKNKKRERERKTIENTQKKNVEIKTALST